MAAITDGTSNTILASERLKGDDASGILNMERDVTNSLNLSTDQFPSAADIETAGAACDTTAQSYQQSNAGRDWMGGMPAQSVFNTVAPPNWDHIACCTGGGFGYACDRNGIVPATSHHPGGVNTATADGSVHFISDTIDLQIYQYLGARQDGKAVQVP